MKTEETRPEELVKHKISLWLKANNFSILWEKKNTFNYPIFKTNGVKRKPDIFFLHRDNPLCQGVLEIKTANTDNNMRHTHKIIEYYDDYTSGKVTYSYNEKSYDPLYFLIGSPYSVDGHLFKKEIISEHTKRNDLISEKILPKYEYLVTGEHFRQLQDYWGGKIDRNDRRNTKYNIGILVSQKLSNLKAIDAPPAFSVGLHTKTNTEQSHQ